MSGNGGGYEHIPVMLAQAIEYLTVRPGGVYVDATVGGGGHALEIARRMGEGRLIAVDRDAEAVEAAARRLKAYADKVVFVNDNYENIDSILKSLGIESVDGILMDLGVSSHQLDSAERGFSYNTPAPLDMRMSRDNPLTAGLIVNTYPQQEIERIIREYSEERFARRISVAICRERGKKRIETTTELAEIVKEAIPAASRREGPHPARRTFQAIRIAVNRELESLEAGLSKAIGLLSPGGRIVVITFHSLEDRIVKNAFAQAARGCTCPPDFPRCMCGARPLVRLLTKKPVTPTEEETDFNPRSRSAKLRAAEKI